MNQSGNIKHSQYNTINQSQPTLTALNQSQKRHSPRKFDSQPKRAQMSDTISQKEYYNRNHEELSMKMLCMNKTATDAANPFKTFDKADKRELGGSVGHPLSELSTTINASNHPLS